MPVFVSSVTQSCLILRNPMGYSTPIFPVLYICQSLFKLMSITVMPSNYLILCHLFLFLRSIFPSIRIFSNESAVCIRWPKYGSFSFNISPSNEYSGLISFRIDWLDCFAFKGALQSFLKHHSLKASILRCSLFFMVQVSHPLEK